MNTNAKLRDFADAEPFVPFEVELANGRKFRVDHPDFISVPAARFDRYNPYFIFYDKRGNPHSLNPILVGRISSASIRSRSSRRG